MYRLNKKYDLLKIFSYFCVFFLTCCGNNQKINVKSNIKETNIHVPMAQNIVNGQIANVADFPSVGKFVYLKDSTTYSCTGTLIDVNTAPMITLKIPGDYLMLTAGHCTVDENGQALAAKNMTFTLPAIVGKAALSFSVVVTYTDYSNVDIYGLTHDLALVEVHPNFLVKKPITTSSLYDGKTNLPPQATSIGFGSSTADSKDFGTMRKANLPILGYVYPISSKQYSVNSNNGFQANNWLVLGTSTGTTSDCFGDSGGPYFVKVAGKTVISAIVSHGNSECTGYNFGSNINLNLYNFSIKSINNNLLPTASDKLF